MDREHHSFYVHEQLMEVDEFMEIECPVIQLDCQHEKTVNCKTHRVHELGEDRE